MNPLTGLPVVADEKCTSCGACLKACPKGLFELRKRGKKDKKIYVACRNEDKGNIAKKSCEVACTGCNKCFLVCPYEAIVVNNFLAYINSDKCTLCRKCVPECPTDAILEIGFPPHKDKMEDTTATSETILKSDKTEGIDSDETINNQEV
jgi:Na+-translocating ferredoxin:NAD+ oxidoreductase RNF subunit RnfB